MLIERLLYANRVGWITMDKKEIQLSELKLMIETDEYIYWEYVEA